MLECAHDQTRSSGAAQGQAGEGGAGGEPTPVAIKKYANRRLYHTGSSEYVTLEDLARMVKAGEDFIVSDAKTGEDLTRSVLAQIIFEQENKGQNLLPITFMRQLIRLYGDSLAVTGAAISRLLARKPDQQSAEAA